MKAAFEPIVTTAGLTAAARAHVEDRALLITHVAIGDEAWVPDATATELRNERMRVPVESRSLIGTGVWKVTTTITGEADFFAREIGFFADDDGTPVLLFVYAHDTKVFAGVTTGQETEFELQVSLAAVPEGTVEFAFLDASQTIQDLIDDARNRHNLGGNFNFALTRDLKYWKAVAVEELEREAMIWRATGQSGLTVMRQYAYGGDDALFRPGAVNFSALGQHDHPEYRMMSGLPELQAAINGYPVQTRHTDYRWLEAADGRYLANTPAGRVGTMDCSIAPLTEPDMRTTHPALWIGPSKCQLKLGRYLRGVKFLPSGFQRDQSSCEPGNRIGPRHARTVGLVPDTPAAVRGAGGSPAARPHCQEMSEKEAGSLLLTHDDRSQPTADMSVEYTQSLDTLFRAKPEVSHPPVEVAAETRHTR